MRDYFAMGAVGGLGISFISTVAAGTIKMLPKLSDLHSKKFGFEERYINSLTHFEYCTSPAKLPNFDISKCTPKILNEISNFICSYELEMSYTQNLTKALPYAVGMAKAGALLSVVSFGASYLIDKKEKQE